MSDSYKNYVTPVGRASFLHIQEKQEQLNGDMKYTASFLIPKSDEDGVKDIKRQIHAAIVAKWGEDKAKWPKNLDIPLRNGDDKANEAKEKGKDMETYRDMFYMNTKSDYQPGVVGPTGKPLMDANDLWPGCYVRYNVSFYAYTKGGNSGVGVGLQNIMLVKQSEDRWDGRQDATKAFAAYAEPEAEDDIGGEEKAAETAKDSADDLDDFD